MRTPKSFKLGEDLTKNPPRPMDAALLDDDVLDLMQSLYPTLEEFVEVSKKADEMSKFWTDVSYGRRQVAGRLDERFGDLDADE